MIVLSFPEIDNFIQTSLIDYVSRILNLSKQPIEKKTETMKATREIYGK